MMSDSGAYLRRRQGVGVEVILHILSRILVRFILLTVKLLYSPIPLRIASNAATTSPVSTEPSVFDGGYSQAPEDVIYDAIVQAV
jgi:hypothetical protein